MLAVEQTAPVVKDTTERRLKRVKIGLMRNPKFVLWSGILMVGKTLLSDKVSTAYTNGRDETYGRGFVDGLQDTELAFVILHENLHKAFRHLFTWRKLHDENPLLANAACDYVINLMLVNMDPNEQHIAIPRKDGKVYGLLDTRFKGMNAKQVFDILKKEQEEGGGGGKPCEPDGDQEGGGGFDEHGWDEAAEMSEEEAEQVKREVDQAIRQGQMNHQKMHGKGSGDLELAIGELLTPKIDWRELMREFVKTICNAKDASSWRRPNRRFLHAGIYMPTLIGERVGRIVVGIDTSGSISGDELTTFLTEVKCICDDVRPNKVDLIYWDGEVAGHEEYEGDAVANIVSSTKPVGGGGTDPTCVQNYLIKNNITPECIVMLTDGYVGSWGDKWNAPILWAISGNPTATATCGKTVHIED